MVTTVVIDSAVTQLGFAIVVRMFCTVCACDECENRACSIKEKVNETYLPGRNVEWYATRAICSRHLEHLHMPSCHVLRPTPGGTDF